jgi:hypothetical protein
LSGLQKYSTSHLNSIIGMFKWAKNVLTVILS